MMAIRSGSVAIAALSAVLTTACSESTATEERTACYVSIVEQPPKVMLVGESFTVSARILDQNGDPIQGDIPGWWHTFTALDVRDNGDGTARVTAARAGHGGRLWAEASTQWAGSEWFLERDVCEVLVLREPSPYWDRTPRCGPETHFTGGGFSPPPCHK